MDSVLGYSLYILSLLSMGGIYAIIVLGLNIQWGFAGLFNAGVAGFVAVGAYTYAFLTTDSSPFHYGGFGLPLAVGAICAMLISGVVAACIGVICIRLRSDYLAIATVGIAETIKLILNNEAAITNGPRGIGQIPRAWESLSEERFYSSVPMSWLMEPGSWKAFFESLPNWWWQPLFSLTVLVCVFVLYTIMEKARKSPWGRMMMAIRENEIAAMAAGKNVHRRRIEAFIFGAFLMGLAGALLAQHIRLIDPVNTFDSAKMTFLVWVMLIVGGSGNNRGAILGAFLMWTLWSSSELFIQFGISFLTSIQDIISETTLSSRAAFLRMMFIGVFLQIVIQKYPQGLLPESRSTAAGKRV